MKVLAVETSCDETGIALVEGRHEGGRFEFGVHKAALLSQAKLHAPYGGVYPNLAKREHYAVVQGIDASGVAGTPRVIRFTVTHPNKRVETPGLPAERL